MVDVKFIEQLIKEDNVHKFYCRKEWKNVRADVLKYDHNECQHCKRKGIYKRAKTVHHIKHLRDRPDLALDMFDPETNERQLISLCNECHELEHPEERKIFKAKEKDYVTEEMW